MVSASARLLDRRSVSSSTGANGKAPNAQSGVRKKREKRATSGVAVGDLLQPASLPMRALEGVRSFFHATVGGELLSLYTPSSVAATRKHVIAVEGAKFANTAELDVGRAFASLCAEGNRRGYNAAGLIYIQALMEQGARVRYQVYEHIARNPRVALEETLPPVFVVGLPRTGSSHLHALLSTDPATATTKLWEMMEPLPLCQPGSMRYSARLAGLKLKKSAMAILAPGWNAACDKFHRVAMDSPEEEAVALAGCGVSIMPFVCVGGAGTAYEDLHCDPTSKRAAFRFLRRFLQLLEWRRHGEGLSCAGAAPKPRGEGAGAERGPARWLLKSHYNVLWMDTVLEEFPGAKVVITVRDPAEVIQSFLSYAVTNLSFVADGKDAVKIARAHATAAYSYLTNVSQELAHLHRRLKGKGCRVSVARYDTLVTDPELCMRRIYADLDLPLDQVTLECARAYLSQSKQHSLGAPLKMDIGEIGITPEKVARDFKEYREELLEGTAADGS
mmetsp:Transcript_16472/g.50562  ORF Transcript_16472/g.50562 Transcript_16472/m.50562 type:complete len:503 (+) Transcript_16472:84-1592(+)